MNYAPALMDAMITASDFDALKTAITDNATVIIPVGIAVMGSLVAIKLIPKIIKFFVK